jgi:hypothetical protein
MKKAAFVAVVLAALAVWAIVVFSADDTSGMREWPLGLGTLDSVPKRHPELLADLRTPRVRERMERARELTARGSWEDLRAAHEISRDFWSRPDLISAMVAISIEQGIVDAAKQLPGPPPPWFEQLRAFDHRRGLVAALQTDTWRTGVLLRDIAYSSDAGANWLSRAADQTFMVPVLEVSRADFLENQRRVAYRIASGSCTFEELPWWNKSGQMAAPNVTEVCRRMMKLRADLDAIRPRQ